MAANNLVINADKTHLLVMGTQAMSGARQVQLRAGEHLILPTPTEKLLGCNIPQSMKWGEHLQNNENLSSGN